MRAAWFFCTTTITPGSVEPAWPGGVKPASVNVGAVYDCRVLQSGAAPADHVHFVRGTRSDDNYESFDLGDEHYHAVQWYNSGWKQITFRGAPHDHPFEQQGVRYLPDYFFMFAYGDDADIALLDAAANWAIAGETVDGMRDGDIDDVPANFNPVQWANRLRVAFGIELPSQITTQNRMVNWFGPLCAPNQYDWWDDRRFR